MDINGRIVVVTGAGHGIGRALCFAFAQAGASTVVAADIDSAAAEVVAGQIDGLGIGCDVSDESEVQALVAQVLDRYGRIDIFCSNAGIGFGDGGDGSVAAADNAAWNSCWEVNVMAHVYAARAVIPPMIANGGGYLVNTASAAGLLNQIGDAAYSTTKHAAIGFAEATAITHGDQGIKVSVVCPQYVATRLIGVAEGESFSHMPGVISPEEAAEKVLLGIRQERFLILTHDEVTQYWHSKFTDYDHWLGSMRKLRRRLLGDSKVLDIKAMTNIAGKE